MSLRKYHQSMDKGKPGYAIFDPFWVQNETGMWS
ncbi:unnamed protein product [Rodentolepis nana]|uniref:Calpain catalytic domain-containing protein n=1 Tax=Rodentolepis nana TaxID=102285 RepID=A0A0R3U0A2_RODNA|nr:unnamed protein product [Rodentolepis nana]